MQFNLDFLRRTGEALSSFGKDKEVDTDERSSVEKYDDFLKTTEVMKEAKTEDAKAVESIDDTGVTESVKEVLNKEEKEKKEDEEDNLEKKLAKIEKVIETFSGSGGTTTIENKSQLPTAVNLNQRALDMGQVQAKAAQADYLKPSTVPNDRIALLYEDLKKYNLI